MRSDDEGLLVLVRLVVDGAIGCLCLVSTTGLSAIVGMSPLLNLPPEICRDFSSMTSITLPCEFLTARPRGVCLFASEDLCVAPFLQKQAHQLGIAPLTGFGNVVVRRDAHEVSVTAEGWARRYATISLLATAERNKSAVRPCLSGA